MPIFFDSIPVDLAGAIREGGAVAVAIHFRYYYRQNNNATNPCRQQ